MAAAGAIVGWNVGSRAPGRSCQIMRMVGDPSGFGRVSSPVNVTAGAGRVMDGSQAIDVPVFFPRASPPHPAAPTDPVCRAPTGGGDVHVGGLRGLLRRAPTTDLCVAPRSQMAVREH